MTTFTKEEIESYATNENPVVAQLAREVERLTRVKGPQMHRGYLINKLQNQIHDMRKRFSRLDNRFEFLLRYFETTNFDPQAKNPLISLAKSGNNVSDDLETVNEILDILEKRERRRTEKATAKAS